MRSPAVISLSVCLLLAFVHHQGGALPLYHATAFDRPGIDGWSQAFGINDLGQMAGDTTPIPSPFIWSSAAGLERLPLPDGAPSGSASDINNSMQVAGYVDTATGRRAALWSSGEVTLLEPSGTTSSFATAINDNGVIVGRHGSYAFVWQGAAVTYLGNETEARDINNLGTAVGWSGGSNSQATIWVNGSDMSVIGGLEGSHESNATGINENGRVVGSCSFPSQYLSTRGFVWQQQSGMRDIGALPDAMGVFPEDINENGWVVGRVYYPERPHAFLWTEDGGMIDLDDVLDSESQGWNLWSAYAINDVGQIVGYGVNPSLGGNIHAFLLTPVPEPSSLALLACNIAVLGCAAWRRRGRPYCRKHPLANWR